MSLPRKKKFGQRWQALVATEDDWSDECRSSGTAFATTERRGPLDTLTGTIEKAN